MANNWHKQFLENLEEWLRSQSKFMDRYDIWNSNNRRLYLPWKPDIARKEILSNPDMILMNNETENFDFIIEVEYQINYKKIVGISLLTDMAVRRMNPDYSSTLILITKKDFPNSKLIEKEIQGYVADKNIKFHLTNSNDFSWMADILDIKEEKKSARATKMSEPKSDFRPDEKEKEGWICPECGHENPMDNETFQCQRCGHVDPDWLADYYQAQAEAEAEAYEGEF